MSAVRCPECHLPVTRAEAVVGVCPSCGGRVSPYERPKVPQGPGGPSDGQTVRVVAPPRAAPRGLWALIAAVAVTFLAVGAYYGVPAVLKVTRPAAAPPDTVVAKDEAPAPAPSAPETPAQVAQAATASSSTAVQAAVVSQDPPVTRVDEPKGTYTVPVIKGGKTVRLAGTVSTLKVGEVSGGGTLDASGLVARRVVCSGPITGRASVMLSAPDGTVEFARGIDGESTVVVSAPGGRITFPTKEEACISGGSSVSLTARDVDLRRAIDGEKTRVVVTVSKSGVLRFAALKGTSVLEYRKADPSDPDPRLGRGSVGPGAEVKRLE
jgi:hypothetical protein